MKNMITTLLLALALGVAPAIASASIELVTVVEIEVEVTDKDGKKSMRRMPAAKVVPGTEVIYTITAKNTGKQAAQNVTIKDPIPEHMTYVDGSAKGKGADISFSVDGGETYAKPGKLTVKDEAGKTRKANAEDYTHVRWVLKFNLKPDQVAPVWFRAKLK